MMTTSVPPPADILTPEHRHQLEVESAIPADILTEEGIYSIEPGRRAART